MSGDFVSGMHVVNSFEVYVGREENLITRDGQEDRTEELASLISLFSITSWR